MFKFGRLTGVFLVVGIAASTVLTTTPAKAEEVYFIRGFMNIWSRGMDQMASKLRARGVNAKAISNGQWEGIARDIVKRSKSGAVSYPIIIAGHSTGGQEAPQFANTLAKSGVPVKLVIGVDPGFAAPPPFTTGSERVVNFYIKNSGRGKPYRATASFNGSITNIDIRPFSNADHTQLEKDPVVQARIIGQVMSALGQ
jgi:hypothetical protein